MKRKLLTAAGVIAFFAIGAWLMQLAIKGACYALLFLLTI